MEPDREEHSMDRCRRRPELSERFGRDLYGPIPWCLTFRENLCGPMAVKVCEKLPRDWYWSMEGSSQPETVTVGTIFPETQRGTGTVPFCSSNIKTETMPVPEGNRRSRKLEPLGPSQARTVTEPNRGHPAEASNCLKHILLFTGF